jgi:hypothetical protein
MTFSAAVNCAANAGSCRVTRVNFNEAKYPPLLRVYRRLYRSRQEPKDRMSTVGWRRFLLAFCAVALIQLGVCVWMQAVTPHR